MSLIDTYNLLDIAVNVFEVELAQFVAFLERYDHLAFILDEECTILADEIECHVIVDDEVPDSGDVVELLRLAASECVRASLDSEVPHY